MAKKLMLLHTTKLCCKYAASMQHSQCQLEMTRISSKSVVWINLGVFLKKKPKKRQYSDVAAICYNMQQICSKYVALLKNASGLPQRLFLSQITNFEYSRNKNS